MYRYFMDYDLTQYQQLENKLNELSQKGLHPVHLGRISSFKEKDTHYYYHVDILTKKPSVPQKKAIRDMINDYERQAFDYVGKIGKFMIFRTENKRQIPKERKKAIDEQLSVREISTLVYFVLALIPSLYLSYHVFKQNQISYFLTNGSIILHYSIFVIVIMVLLRVLHKLILAHNYQKEKEPFLLLNKLFYIFAALSFCLIVTGCILDTTDRKQKHIDSQMLTLGYLGLEDNFQDYSTYTKTSSLIVESSSYVESNQNDEAIYSKEYIFHQKKNINKYFDLYKEDLFTNPYISINKNTYIINIDGQNDSLLFKTKQGFVYVTTNLEIYDSQLYLQMIDFYK